MSDQGGSSGGGKPPDWNEMKDKLTAAKGPDRLILIAGLLFFVDSFLPWYGGSFGPITINVSGWSSRFWAVFAILLALGATGVALASVAGMMAHNKQTSTILLGLSAGAFVFAVLRFLTQTSGSKYGLYVAIVLGGVMAYGAYQKYSKA